ncbi:MAG: hypothetical protein ACRDRR_19930 [Pseudonocardiaceae bacterium]
MTEANEHSQFRMVHDRPTLTPEGVTDEENRQRVQLAILAETLTHQLDTGQDTSITIGRIEQTLTDQSRAAALAGINTELAQRRTAQRAADGPLGSLWREAAEITYHERVIDYGNDGRPEDDRALGAHDQARREVNIATIAEQTGMLPGYIRQQLDDAAYAHGRAPGTDADPDHFAPPDWAELTQRGDSAKADAAAVGDQLHAGRGDLAHDESPDPVLWGTGSATVLDELDQARARVEAGDVPAEHEHHHAAYIERLDHQAQHAADDAVGGPADAVLDELITDLDATAPDPYPGDEAYQTQLAPGTGEASSDPLGEALRDRDIAIAQLLHEMLYTEGPPVPPGQAAEFAAYAEMWVQEALADYDRDLHQRTEHDQAAQGRTHSDDDDANQQQAGSAANSAAPVTDAVDLTGTDGNQPPGKPPAADAVDAAHATATASARALDDRENPYTLPVVHQSGAEAAAAAIAADDRENTYTQHGPGPMTRAAHNQLLAQVINAAAGAVHHAHHSVAETQTPHTTDRPKPGTQWDASQAGEVLSDE